MSEAIESAFEAGQGIIFEDESSNQAGLFCGDLAPETVVPDAPLASIYLRTSNGRVYSRHSETGNGVPSDWQEGTGGSVSSANQVPFCLNDSLPSNITLIAGQFPFYLNNTLASFISII